MQFHNNEKRDRIKGQLAFVFQVLCLLFANSEMAFCQNHPSEKTAESAIDQFAYSGIISIRGMRSIDDFRLLGPVLQERHENKINPHDQKSTDEFVELKFDGLVIYGRMDMQPSKNFLPIRAKISSSKWSVASGLNIGEDAKIVRGKLGHPKKVSYELEEYCGETECIRFHFSRNKISSIEFFYYAD
jgi:hypothetical protein